MSAFLPLILSQAIVAGQGPASAADLSNFYNPRQEITFSGTVTGKTKGQAPGYAQGMSILVKSGKNLREVELGPAWYVGRQQATVNVGDKVRVTAVPLMLDRRQRVFLARQIVRGKQVLALRDTGGNPFWTARRSNRVAVSGAAQRMDNAYKGTIGDARTFMVNGEEYAGYVLNTPDGPVNVAVAPTWYWNNQPTYFNRGDNVTFYGNSPIVLGGNNTGAFSPRVVILGGAAYDGGTLVLRPGGIPVYGGFRPFVGP